MAMFQLPVLLGPIALMHLHLAAVPAGILLAGHRCNATMTIANNRAAWHTNTVMCVQL